MSGANRTEIDVLIIGAGPVGLTLANELLRRGVGVRVLERSPAIREISKAMILHVRTQEALSKLGVMERVIAEAQPLTEVVVNAYGKHIGSWQLDRLPSAYEHPLIIGQNRTQHLLLEKLESLGLRIDWSSEVTTLSITDEGVTADVRRGNESTQVRARYVIGCEGSDSVVRKTVGLNFVGERYAGEQFIQADCRIRWTLPTGRSYLFLTEVGYMMVIEMLGGVARIFISLPDAPGAAGAAAAASTQGAAEDVRAAPTLDEIRDNLVRLSGVPAELSEPIWLARYRTSHRYANKFRSGPAFVAGDAGHVHVPIGGQGMNTGIQDACNLGWKLAGVLKGLYREEILDTYNTERHKVARGLISGTDRAYRGVLHPGALQQHAARHLGPSLMRLAPVQAFMRSTLEQLSIAYPDTPLNRDCGGSGPRPGERAPSGTGVRLDDLGTVDLYHVLQPEEWVLLLFGGSPGASYRSLLAQLDLPTVQRARARAALRTVVVVPDAVPPGPLGEGVTVLMDGTRVLHNRYRASAPALFLIRPDTFLSFRGTPENAAALDAHLATLFA